jgi:ATP-binding cassette subfamily B protein
MESARPRAIGAKRRGNLRPITFVQQVTSTGCGPACLVMVLRYFGLDVDIDRISRRIAVVPGGTFALDLLREARSQGLRAWAVRLRSPAYLAQIPRASILHWRDSHYVVFDRCTRQGIKFVDPRSGERFCRMVNAPQAFRGLALCFEPASHSGVNVRS